MSVHNGFAIEKLYGFTHTFWHMSLIVVITVEDLEDKRQWQARQRVQKWLTAEQRDDRQKDNSDRRRLVHLHLSKLCHFV